MICEVSLHVNVLGMVVANRAKSLLVTLANLKNIASCVATISRWWDQARKPYRARTDEVESAPSWGGLNFVLGLYFAYN